MFQPSKVVQDFATIHSKMVYNSNNYGLWYANNELVDGVYKPFYN